jgi:serine protease
MGVEMKMKWLISIVTIVGILFALGVIPAGADQGALKEFHQPKIGKPQWVSDEILVKSKGDAEHFRVVKVSEGKVLEKVKEYLKRSDVDYAEPNYYAYALWTPNDPYYRYQWDLYNPAYGGIQMEAAWGLQTGNASVVVAVVDTGVAYENYSTGGKTYYLAPDLANTAFVPGYDFVENDTHPNDDNSHGTHVTGTIAQSTNNGIGVAGVAFNTSIMPVKVLDTDGSGTYDNVANGIYWATNHSAKIINLSLGGSTDSPTLKDAVEYAYEHGVTVIAAAGNDGSSQVSYPAAYDDYVIAVGATRYDEKRAYYSNYGASLDIVAPGGDLRVDQNKDGYGDGVLQNTFNPNTKDTGDFGYWFFQGTSMAAPHVSGVAALLLAHGNAATPDEVRAALQGTADDLGAAGWDGTYGWGLVNAYKALQWTAGPNKRPVANAGPDQSAYVGDTVNFNASGSSDPDGSIVSYAWNFGDGATGSGVTATHAYSSAGNYTVTLNVTDNGGLTGSDTALVTITQKPAAPVAYLSIALSKQTTGSRWRITATVTVKENDASGKAIAGATVSANWSGAYSGAVSGTTDSRGKASFRTGYITKSGTVTFTVTKIVKNEQEYVLAGNTSTSI